MSSKQLLSSNKILHLAIFSLISISSIGLVFSQTTDFALAINGSSSISSADFSIQKNGIKQALNDPAIFPRDGSVGFALVQYANTTTEVHIPYTIISNEAVAQNLISRIDPIVQIQGSTNPGDGVARAMSELLNGTGQTKLICLSTDGVPNSGQDIGTAISNARANGLDRIGVLAIQDGGFTPQSYQNAYGPFLLPGESVTVTSNSVEYANLLGSTCAGAVVELIGFEVVQAIQDWNNSVTLIEGKNTFVRVFLQSIDENTTISKPRLIVKDGSGNPLRLLPITASNASTYKVPPKAENDQEIRDRREDWTKSLNFELDPKLVKGTLSFELDQSGSTIINNEPAELGGSENDGIITVNFEPNNGIGVKFIKLENVTNASSLTVQDINELKKRLSAIYPISQANILSLTGKAKVEKDKKPDPVNFNRANYGILLQKVNDRRILDLVHNLPTANFFYYGVARIGDGTGGVGPFGGKASIGLYPQNGLRYGRNTHAHEIAHNLDFPHATSSNLRNTCKFLIEQSGPCGSCASIFEENFDYMFEVNGQTRATIGPLGTMTNVANEIWGYDNNRGEVVNPNENFELMSYCGSRDNPTFWRWISDINYEQIHEKLKLSARSSSNILASRMVNEEIEYLFIRGIVDLDSNSVDLSPLMVISTSNPIPLPDSGEYILKLLNESGQILREIPFSLPDVESDGGPDPTFSIFNLMVENDLDIKQIEIVLNDTILGSISASQTPPTVEVTFPNGGESLTGENVTIEWNGNDLDGDTLTYVLQFSTDGGITWETLDIDISGQSYDIQLEFLGKTNQGLVRVIASDGFNSSADTSDSFFFTPNNPPTVSITSPQNDLDAVGVEPILFQAIAEDREEGNLLGKQLTWSSNLDGLIGMGNNLYLDASEFSEGKHLITVTATDSLGASASDTVSIEIFRVLPLESIATAMVVGVDEVPKGCDFPIRVRLNSVDTIGSFTVTLSWDSNSILYAGNAEILEGFQGVINDTRVGEGVLVFNGARTDGRTGTFDIFKATFKSIGELGSADSVKASFNSLFTAFKFENILSTITSENLGFEVAIRGLIGDVNNDGFVDSGDALIILSNEVGINVGQDPKHRIKEGLGDVNQDSMTNSIDALIILSFDAGFDVNFPVGELPCPKDSDIISGQVLQPRFAATKQPIVLIEAIEDNTDPRLFALPILVDMSDTGKLLGSYGATLSWDTTLFELVEFTGGKTKGFEYPVINEEELSKGKLAVANAYVAGAEGLVNIFNLSLRKKVDTLITKEFKDAISLEFTSMGAAKTFEPLSPEIQSVELLVSLSGSIDPELPLKVYPNPFEDVLTIEFGLNTTGKVDVSVFNSMGQKITTLYRGIKQSGQHRLVWNGNTPQDQKLSDGIYLVQVVSGELRSVHRVILKK